MSTALDQATDLVQSLAFADASVPIALRAEEKPFAAPVDLDYKGRMDVRVAATFAGYAHFKDLRNGNLVVAQIPGDLAPAVEAARASQRMLTVIVECRQRSYVLRAVG